MKLITLNLTAPTADIRAQEQARALVTPSTTSPAAALSRLPVPVIPPPPPRPKPSLEYAAMMGLEIPVYQDVTDEVLGTKKRTERQSAERIIQASDQNLGALSECCSNADGTASQAVTNAKRIREALAKRLLLNCVNESSVAVQCGMEFSEVVALKRKLGML